MAALVDKGADVVVGGRGRRLGETVEGQTHATTAVLEGVALARLGAVVLSCGLVGWEVVAAVALLQSSVSNYK